MSVLFLLMFIGVATVPLLAYRKAEKRAARIRETHFRLGNKEKNPGVRERQWQAKKSEAVIFTAIVAVMELVALRIVDSLGGVVFSAMFALGLGWLISNAFYKPIYDNLDKRAADIQSQPGYVGFVDAFRIVGQNSSYFKEEKALDPVGHGTGGFIPAADSDMVDVSQPQIGGR